MVVGADLVGDRWPGVRARRASGAVVALLVAAAAGGCARQADPADVVAGAVEFEASPTFLRAATDRSADLSYRMEATLAMRMSAGGQSIDVEAPIMTGQQVGGRSSFHVDMGRLMVEMMDDVPGRGPSGAAEDLVADVVVDDETLYVRSAIYAEMAEQADLAPDDREALAQLDERWGRIDADRLPGGSSPVESAAGGQTGDPRLYLELVADADDVDELGDDEVRGVVAHGLGTRVSMAELLEAQGADPDAFLDAVGSGLPDGEADEAAAVMGAIAEVDLSFSVWIDDAGLVRRIGYEFDDEAFTAMVDAMADATGEDVEAPPADMSMGSTIDMFDYGDDDIAVDVPRTSVDVTDAFLALYGSAAG